MGSPVDRLRDKGEEVANVNDESFALDPWVWLYHKENVVDKKGFQLCGNNELVIHLRFCGTPPWICLVCKVEFRRMIDWVGEINRLSMR